MNQQEQGKATNADRDHPRASRPGRFGAIPGGAGSAIGGAARGDGDAVENPPPYWQVAADQGLQGVHLAESVGGQGFGILELAIVLAEFGYGAVPGPFVPSAIASALISAHDPDAKVLAELASGSAVAAYALDSGLTATRQADIW